MAFLETAAAQGLAQGATSLLGGLMGGDNDWANRANVNLSLANLYERQNDRAMQKQFAKRGTGWQLRDMWKAADESGIHRLSVLGGAGGSQYTPGSPVGGTFSSDAGDAFIGDAIGEGLGAAINAQRYQDAREDRAKQNELIDAEIELIRSQSRTEIAKANRIGRQSVEVDGQRQALDPTDHTATLGDKVVDARPDANLRPIVMEDGSVVLVPVGPDIDEVIVGGVTYVYDKVRDQMVRTDRGNARTNRDSKKADDAKRRPITTKTPTTGSSSRKENR